MVYKNLFLVEKPAKFKQYSKLLQHWIQCHSMNALSEVEKIVVNFGRKKQDQMTSAPFYIVLKSDGLSCRSAVQISLTTCAKNITYFMKLSIC